MVRFAFYDAFAPKNVEDRPEEALDVHPKSDLGGVHSIQSGLFLDREFISAVDLGPTGQSGGDVVGAVFVPFFDQVVLVPEGGPGADDGHIALQDVVNLWKLIQGSFSKKPADPCDATIRVFQKVCRGVLWCVGAHSAKFQNHKIFLTDSNAFLPEKNRAFGVDFNDEGYDEKYRRQHNKPH